VRRDACGAIGNSLRAMEAALGKSFAVPITEWRFIQRRAAGLNAPSPPAR